MARLLTCYSELQYGACRQYWESREDSISVLPSKREGNTILVPKNLTGSDCRETHSCLRRSSTARKEARVKKSKTRQIKLGFDKDQRFRGKALWRLHCQFLHTFCRSQFHQTTLREENSLLRSGGVKFRLSECFLELGWPSRPRFSSGRLCFFCEPWCRTLRCP
jgi:hypothetical protein